jgi:hypothetical protein
MTRSLCFAALAIAVSVLSAVQAQEVRASISGVISDPSGSPIPGANIIVTNTARNTRFTAASNESGAYSTPFLDPGAYVMTVEKDGFRRFQRENITLQSLDKARIDVQLQVGAVTDSITVSATVSALQTETASRASTISNELIQNLPTQGRNPFQIAWAAPGVFKTGGWRYLRSFDIGGTTGFSVNGGRSGENEVLIDGISNVRANRTVIHVPTMESVQEFKVLANTYDAQYGRSGGGIVTMVTKSGTNQFHGNLFEYFQNAKLNANQTELNAAGIKKSPNNINAYGFHLSGPIWIPKVFDGRNKLFWTLSYEAMRQRSADPGVVTVPATEWRGGDFATLRNAQNQPVLVYDPLTTAADGTRQPFAANRLPTNRISPIALNALKYYPAPTSEGVGPAKVQNYPYPSRWIADMNQWSGRLDYQINSKNNANFRYGQNPFSEYRGLVFVKNVGESNPAEPTGNAPLLRNGRTIGFNWTSTLNPSTTFDLRAGLNRWEDSSGNSFGTGFDQRQLGFDSNLVSQFTRVAFPQFSFGSYQSMGPSRLLGATLADVYTLQPNMNKVIGRHFLKFGVEARRYNDNLLNPGLAAGNYSFGKNWTQAVANRADAVSGNELATFLLGYPTTATADNNIDPAFVHFYYAGFFQDDWKITNRLTLNLGFRWDYESPSFERYDRMVQSMDFNAASPIAASAQGLTLKGAIRFAGVNDVTRRSFAPDRNNFAPRIGAAYRLREKWVVRGGYGLYYLGENATGSNQGFSQQSTAVVTTDNLRPAVNLSNAFALLPGGRLLSPIGNSQGAASFLGQNVTVNWQNRPLPHSHQYSIDVQRELPTGILIEAGYVGNLTRQLPLAANANFVPVNELNKRTAAGAIDNAYYNAQIPNPMRGLIPVNAALNGATVSRQNLLFAFPQYPQVTVANLPLGKQRYDSFQLKASKRLAMGLTFLSSYTLAKTTEQVSFLNAQDFNLADPSSSPLVSQSADNIDIPHKFNFAGVYELPFGKGRAFASNINRAADLLIGGWEVNANVTYMAGWNIAHPNAAQAVAGDPKLGNPTLERWFDTSLWEVNGRRVSAQEPFTLRNFPLRFSNVRVPGYQNWDASISKYIPIHERLRAQFRFEAVNALNRPWFTGIASVDVTNPSFGRLNPVQGNLPRFLKLGLVLLF